MENMRKQGKKIAIGTAGFVVIVAGIVMIPYPGPGWLVVFAGLAILSTEFVFASRLLAYGKGKYDQWVEWLKRQKPYVRALFFLFTCLVVVTTLWLINAYGFINAFLNLNYNWLNSPLFR